jgi:hypothetical protein
MDEIEKRLASSEKSEWAMADRLTASEAEVARLRRSLKECRDFIESIGEEYRCNRESDEDPPDHLGDDDDPSDCWRCWSRFLMERADQAMGVFPEAPL